MSQESIDEALLAASPMHPVIRDAIELQAKKGETYNGIDDSDPAKRKYFPYGSVSYLTMLHIKLQRLDGILLDKDRVINFESAYDTVLDLINYASFLGAYLKDEEDDS